MSTPSRSRFVPAALWLAFGLALLGSVTFTLQDARFQGASATPAPDLWLPTFGMGGTTLFHIGALNTGIPLAYDALLLVSWSFFGHLPFWDLLLSAIFPGRDRLLYPNATVVGLSAEHPNSANRVMETPGRFARLTYG